MLLDTLGEGSPGIVVQEKLRITSYYNCTTQHSFQQLVCGRTGRTELTWSSRENGRAVSAPCWRTPPVSSRVLAREQSFRPRARIGACQTETIFPKKDPSLAARRILRRDRGFHIPRRCRTCVWLQLHGFKALIASYAFRTGIRIPGTAVRSCLFEWTPSAGPEMCSPTTRNPATRGVGFPSTTRSSPRCDPKRSGVCRVVALARER